MELSPGNRGPNNATRSPDGGKLPNGQVAQTVQLDEIFRTFDPSTRLAFQTWMQQQGVALGARPELNDALGKLTPFAENTDKVLEVLNSQSDGHAQAGAQHRRSSSTRSPPVTASSRS